MNIAQLLGDTVRLLSCSQVITSVHSVVKELVENALDAEASSISIRLENYGLDVIEVKDNGLGVSSDNVKSMALAHTTSKIGSIDDLCTLETYGFRGEALHSVASMASLSVTTRTEGEDIAHKYEFNRIGEVVSCQPAAMERGTTVLVTNLFKQLPVRRQCYRNVKRCKEELKQVENYLLAFGICHPEVRFQLRHNKLTLWQKPLATSFDANVQIILGPSCFRRMSPVNYQCFNPMVKIQGLVPKPHEDLSGITRSTGERVFVFVNKRPVEIKSLAQLVRQAFVDAFPSLKSRYPIAVLSISVLPQALDVNLEPNKTSVLLHDMEFISTTLESLLQQVYSPCKVSAEDAPAQQVAMSLPAPEVSSSEQEGRYEMATSLPAPASEHEGRDEITTSLPAPEESFSEHKDDETECRDEIQNGGKGGRNPAGNGTELVDNDFEDALEFEEQLLEESAQSSISEGSFDELTSDFFEDLDKEIADLTSEETAEETASPDHASGESVDETAHGKNVVATPQPPFQTSLSQWSRGLSSVGQIKPPVKLCHPAISSSHSPSNPPHAPKSKLIPKHPSPVYDMINSQPVKRKSCAASLPTPGSSKRQKQLSSSSSGSSGTRNPWVCTADCQVEFDQGGVQRRWRALAAGHPVSKTPMNRSIGWCQLMEGSKNGVWLVVRDSTIACFNVSGGREESDLLEEGTEELTRSSVQSLLDKRSNLDDLFHSVHKLKSS